MEPMCLYMPRHADAQEAARFLAKPRKLWSRDELAKLPRGSPTIDGPGIYGWYFDRVPLPLRKHKFRHPQKRQVYVRRLFWKWVLLYVGKDENSLRQRVVNQHFDGELVRGKAMSTLRMSLGCLLADGLGLCLKAEHVPPYKWGNDGEQILSRWMTKHARVALCGTSAPGEVENLAIDQYDLPLNRQGNDDHPFHSLLGKLRDAHRNCANQRQEDKSQAEFELASLWDSIRKGR